jgi:hypothetical protein
MVRDDVALIGGILPSYLEHLQAVISLEPRADKPTPAFQTL